RAPDEITIFLQKKRRVQLSRAGYDQLGRGARRQRGTRVGARERLARSAVCAKDVVRSNPAAAKSAEDRGHGHGLAAQLISGNAITDLAGSEVFKMMRQHVAQFSACLKAMLRLVFDRADQDSLDLARKLRINLARTRVFGEIKNQQWIVL